MPNKKPIEDSAPGIASRMPDLKPGKYKDGTPLHEVQFLECKIILKPELLTSTKSFLDYAKIVSAPPRRTTSNARTKGWSRGRRSARWSSSTPPASTSTTTRSSCDGASSTRTGSRPASRRSSSSSGTRTYRRPRRWTCGRRSPGKYDLKFKVEALPLKDQVGGYRLLFSHNVQFPLSQAPEGDRAAAKSLTRVFPVLASALETAADRVELVNQTIVEEVLQDLGTLDFGKGMAAKFNVALWRERGMHRPLVGEFAFQVKFKTLDELNQKAVERARRLFVALQQTGRDYVLLGGDEDGDRLQPQGQSAASARVKAVPRALGRRAR